MSGPVFAKLDSPVNAAHRESHGKTLRALAALLGYPGPELRAALPELATALHEQALLPPARVAELAALMHQITTMDPYEIEARYVQTFDSGRATSLHLFEHVHGESRDRGPALVDLTQTYQQAGLELAPGELPDFVPVVLEFASTQPEAVAREFVAETAHILNAICCALRERDSPYATVLAAVLEWAGHTVQDLPIAAEATLDESWAEPAAFDGCGTQVHAALGPVQPIHFVPKAIRNPISRKGIPGEGACK